jgi:predicted membrane metal-binding protein
MWLADPLIIKDIGFQLSVAAVAGITLWRGKREWETTLAAVMFTFPVIWHYFGQVSLIAVFANLLLLWTVPVIMFLGLVGMITFGWGAILVWPFAKLLIGGVHLLANLPWAAVDLPRISVYGEIFLVILVFTLVWLKTNWQNLR